MKKRLPVVLVWEDAYTSDPWQEITGEAKVEPALVTSYGILLHRDKKHTVIAASVSDDGERGFGLLMVPAGMVRSLKILKGAVPAKRKGKRK